MKGSEANADEDERENKKKVLILGVGLFLLCCLLLVVAVSIIVSIFSSSFDSGEANTTDEVKWQPKRADRMLRERKLLPDESKIKPNGTRVKIRFYSSGNMQHLDKLNLETANEFCKKIKRRLPVPKSDIEELEMLDHMKALHEVANCTYYVIGYKLDENMRYASLNKKQTWPPLTKSKTAASDIENRDCIEIETGPNAHFKVISNKTCKEVTSAEISTLIFHHTRAELCEQNNWNGKCLDIRPVQGNDKDNFVEFFHRSMNVAEDKMVGIALLDREWIPRRLLTQGFTLTRVSWLFEVKYIMNYLDIYNSNLSPYQINVTIFQDPERDCVAVNSQKGFQIETVLCDETGCPACES